MSKVLETYLNRLVNLSGNNRSLLLLRTTKSQDMDLHDLDFALNESSFALMKQFIEDGKHIKLCKALDYTDAKSNEASLRLKNIKRKNEFLFEERGAQDLYLGWPFVCGKFVDGTVVRCPLAFFPIELEIDAKNYWVMKKKKDVLSSFNKNFLLAYSYFNDVVYDEELGNTTLDDFEKDITVFRTELYQTLKNSLLEMHFNQDLFTDKLEAFKSYKKEDFSKKYDIGQLKLESNAVIGIFPQNSSYLFPDYQKLIADQKIPDIETLFKSKHLDLGQYKEELVIKESSLYNAFKIDASQEAVIQEVKKGKSLIVQGPPGTGKSQLICNLVTDFMARGKKVLVVCQKRAALDVVGKRLSEKNIRNFIGLVHDYKADRKIVYEQISRQINSVDDYQHRNNGLDTILLERTFQQCSNTITQISEELTEFKDALFDTHECGLSIKELYLGSNPRKPFIDLRHAYSDLPFHTHSQLIKKIKSYLLYSEKFEDDNYVLKNRKSFRDFSIKNLKKFGDLIPEIRKTHDELITETNMLLDEPINLEEALWVQQRKGIFYELIDDLAGEEVFDTFKHYVPHNVDFSRFNAVADRIYECYNDDEIELSVKSNNLGKLAEVLQKAIQAKSDIFKWISFYFSKEKYILKKAILANHLDFKKRSLKILERRLDNRLNLEHNFSTLEGLSWIPDLPKERSIQVIKEWLILQKKGLLAREKYQTLRSFKNFFSFKNLTRKTFKEKVEDLFKSINKASEKYNDWQSTYNSYQINKVISDEQFAHNMIKALQEDFESLVEFDQIKDSFDEYELAVLEELIGEVGHSEEKVLQLLDNSLKMEWIRHIEEKYPILRKVSTRKFDQLEMDLQSNIEEKLDISSDILQLKAREITYKQVEYNRLKNPVTYRKLEKQVNKKRKIWPLRKVVAECSEELFDLIPCWLCSPETASAIFPLNPIFDLVIFDEASQCFAENALPSVVRGKQVIIVGDSKQLSPNDLYQVRWEGDNEEDNMDLDAESILDLGSLYLPDKKLKHHYRSQSLELMEFSNKAFYDSSLKILPSFVRANEKDPPIEYIKVDGIWEHNQNVKEAEEVVKLVSKLNDKEVQNIGVVTFNAKQQELIRDMIEEKVMRNEMKIGDDFIIKNIENIQGDERDIIIFSVAYAPGKSGKLNIQFGSLNMHKGENRLNVAISRAREKVYIVSSIEPEQLKVENTKNEGPKLFKEYLKYARKVSAGEYIATPYTVSEGIASDMLLSTKLVEMDDSLFQELPFADVTQKENGKYTRLILTDDNNFYREESPKETHCYTPMFLKEKKWKFKRFYSRQWWDGKVEL